MSALCCRHGPAAAFLLVHAEPVLLRLGARYGPGLEDLDDWEAGAELWADGRPQWEAHWPPAESDRRQ
jgi:hypothetical protein